MVRWLAKAAEVWRRREPPPPQPYDLACQCGHRVSGMRQASFLAVRCNRCGEPVFVLPADIYPRPKPKKSAKKAAAAASVAVKDDPEKTAAAGSGKGSGKLSGEAVAVGKPTGQSARSTVKSASLQEDRSPKTRVIEMRRRSLFTPIRLIAMAIVVVVAGTGYFAWQSSMKEKAALTLRQHVESGEEAFRAGRLPDAAEELRQASLAVDRLGRSDPESQRIRQRAKELDAIVNLSTTSLYDVCEQMRESGGDEAKWADRAKQLNRNAWFVIEGDVVREAGPDGTIQPLIRFPFPIDQSPVMIDAKLKALDALPSAAGPTKVIFSGQLASFAKEGQKDPVWVIRFDDKTAFLWTDDDIYQAIGLGTDDPQAKDETSRTLDQQGSALGVKP